MQLMEWSRSCDKQGHSNVFKWKLIIWEQSKLDMAAEHRLWIWSGACADPPVQRAATEAVLGWTKQQDPAEGFSLCDSAAGLWYSTIETVSQKEGWETGDTTEEAHKRDLKAEEYALQVNTEECLGDGLITACLHRKCMPTIKRHGQGRQHSQGLAAHPVQIWRRNNSLMKYINLQDKLGSGFAALWILQIKIQCLSVGRLMSLVGGRLDET